MKTYLDTSNVSSRDRLGFWRQALCDSFVELECGSNMPTEFNGSIASRTMGEIQFSNVKATRHFVSRTRSTIAKSGKDCFLLSLQTEGTGILEQDGRIANLQPGDFVLYDTARPYDLRFDGPSNHIVLRLPRRVVSGRLADPERFTASRVDGNSAIGRLTSTIIRQMYDSMDELPETSINRLHATMVDLTATALVEQAGANIQGSEWQVMLRRRVLNYIDANLSDPRLSCATVAAANGISERYLRKVFEESVSLSEWIWTRRLDQAKRDLSDPLLAHLGITAIGYDVGFKDSAHFSRAFKTKFGVTPSQYRANALSSVPCKLSSAG